MQFITGVYLLIELTWFNVFGDVAPLLAGLAFTVYCIHWFAMAHLVCHGSSSLHRGDRRAGWLDGDRVLVPQLRGRS